MATRAVRPSTVVRRAVRVAEILRKSKRAVSSKELAKQLRLTRSQVLRLLSLLKEAGCQIESVRGRGAGFRWVKGPRNLPRALEKAVAPKRPAKRAPRATRPVTADATKQVLQMLRRASPKWVTGSAIAQKLGVSRQRVHQFIAKLREAGYKIEGQPKLGYRLLGGRAKRAPARKGSKVRKRT